MIDAMEIDRLAILRAKQHNSPLHSIPADIADMTTKAKVARAKRPPATR